MDSWTYVAHRMNGDGTSTPLDPDLPLGDVTVTKILSGPDGLTGSIAPAVARLVGPDGRPIIRRWSTAIFAVDPGNEIRGGCIVSDVRRNPATAMLSITGVGFTDAIKGQPFEGSEFHIQKDALDLGRRIWDHWQSRPGGNLGLVLDRKTMTGTKVGTELKQVEFDTQEGPVAFESGPYKLNEYETDDLGGKFNELATEYGFDYAESHYWIDSETIGHRLDFGVPRIGRRRDDLRFVVGENVTMHPDRGETDYASHVLTRGAGDGPTTLRKWTPRSGEDRLRRIAIVDDKKLKSDASLLKRGQLALPYYMGAPEISEIIVRDHDNAKIGSWVEGDEVKLVTDDEWGDEDIWVRIMSTTFMPKDLGVARLSVVRADTLPS